MDTNILYDILKNILKRHEPGTTYDDDELKPLNYYVTRRSLSEPEYKLIADFLEFAPDVMMYKTPQPRMTYDFFNILRKTSITHRQVNRQESERLNYPGLLWLSTDERSCTVTSYRARLWFYVNTIFPGMYPGIDVIVKFNDNGDVIDYDVKSKFGVTKSVINFENVVASKYMIIPISYTVGQTNNGHALTILVNDKKVSLIDSIARSDYTTVIEQGLMKVLNKIFNGDSRNPRYEISGYANVNHINTDDYVCGRGMCATWTILLPIACIENQSITSDWEQFMNIFAHTSNDYRINYTQYFFNRVDEFMESKSSSVYILFEALFIFRNTNCLSEIYQYDITYLNPTANPRVPKKFIDEYKHLIETFGMYSIDIYLGWIGENIDNLKMTFTDVGYKKRSIWGYDFEDRDKKPAVREKVISDILDEFKDYKLMYDSFLDEEQNEMYKQLLDKTYDREVMLTVHVNYSKYTPSTPSKYVRDMPSINDLSPIISFDILQKFPFGKVYNSSIVENQNNIIRMKLKYKTNFMDKSPHGYTFNSKYNFPDNSTINMGYKID
jgi:hypothetical protein